MPATVSPRAPMTHDEQRAEWYHVIALVLVRVVLDIRAVAGSLQHHGLGVLDQWLASLRHSLRHVRQAVGCEQVDGGHRRVDALGQLRHVDYPQLCRHINGQAAHMEDYRNGVAQTDRVVFRQQAVRMRRDVRLPVVHTPGGVHTLVPALGFSIPSSHLFSRLVTRTVPLEGGSQS